MMHPIKALIIFIILEFVTIFAWFAVARNLLTVINAIVSAISMTNVRTVGQNVVTGMNLVFIVLLFAWAGWFAYVCHRHSRETSFQTFTAGDLRRL